MHSSNCYLSQNVDSSMASLQEIEKELQTVNDAVFQQLCDEYLFHSEDSYPHLNRPGSQKTKRKTKKGTPDTYWMLPTGKYVFCEYTTKNKGDSKPAFLKKLKEDVKKCLDETVTGISPNLIKKIILCFNSEILPKEMEAVKRILGKKRIDIVFNSLDTIAMNLYSRYPNIAARYLGTSVDTGQVLPIEEFITEYSPGNSITTPLNNQFLFREKELIDLKNDLLINDIVVLTGQPGVGKSKLAVQTLIEWQTGNADYEVYCLSNKNVNIFDDLKTYIKPHKNYLVFVDDANRQSDNLRSILTFKRTRRTGNLKLIITVRDYALEFIKRICVGLDYKIELLEPLSDEQLEALLKSNDFGITNPTYLKRILQIAKGNPRIAIMVARLALQHQDLEVLYDLFDLYDAYFNSFINDHDLLNNKELQKALGLVSFFYTINRSDKERFQKLLDAFNLNYHKFTEALVELEKMELVETSTDNTIIKIGDQVLSTYFFYKCFIKEKTLSFKILLHNYFEDHRNRFSDTLIPSQNDFGYGKVIDLIQSDLLEYFNSVSSDKEKAYKFINTLWFAIPDHTLAFLQAAIDELPTPDNPEFVADTNDRNQTSPDDENLKILQGYFYQNSTLILSGLELAFSYVQKKPALFNSLYKLILACFTFTFEDERYGFYRQNKLIDFLIDNTHKDHRIYVRMFFSIFGEIMASSKMVTTSSWKRNAISIYKYALPNNKYVREIRKKIWAHANKFFTWDPQQAEEAIFKYIEPSMDYSKGILEFDLKYLLAIIDKHFTPSKFSHAYHVQKVISRFTKIGISSEKFALLKEVYTTPEYKIYKLLDMNMLRGREQHEYESIDFDKFERIKDVEIRYKLSFSTLPEFEKFYTAFCEVWLTPHFQNWSFNGTMDVIINDTYLQNRELCFEFLRLIQQRNNPTGFNPSKIFATINANNPDDLDRIFNLVTSGEYAAKAHWILSFSFYLNEKYVTERYYRTVLHTYQNLTHSIWLDFAPLTKYQQIDPQVFIKVLQIFISKSLEGIRITLDFHFFENYVDHFRNEIELLKQAYFICEKTQQAFDHDGKDIIQMVRLDSNFLLEYVVHHTKDKYAISIREFDHLSALWELENIETLIKQVFQYLASQRFYYVREDFANAFFKNLSVENKKRAVDLLMKYMLANKKNTTKVNMIFDVFRNSLREHYFACISTFLKVNNSIQDFKKLELLNNHFMSNGDVIWSEVKATELENIVNEISKLPHNSQYSQHKAYLRNWIIIEKRSAEQERKRKFMEDHW
jgi:hypothetical protein